MSHDEFAWWGAADDLGLLPDPVVDLAKLRSTVVNAAGGKTTADDFIPQPPPTPDDEVARMMRLFPPKG